MFLLLILIILIECRSCPLGNGTQGATSNERQAFQKFSPFHKYVDGIGRVDCRGIMQAMARSVAQSQRCESASIRITHHGVVLIGCASVLKTCVLRSRVSGGENS